MEHIAKVLEVAETFEKDLKGGTGYEGMFFLSFSRILEMRMVVGRDVGCALI